MRMLLSVIFYDRRYYPLVILAFITLFLLAFVSQFEIYTIGIVTNKGESLGGGYYNPLQGMTESLFHYLVEMGGGSLTSLGILFFIAASCKSIVLFISRFTNQYLATVIDQDLRQRYFEHIQLLPMNFHQKHLMGTLSAKAILNTSQIAEAFLIFLNQYLYAPIVIISSLVSCFLLSWKLSLFIFVGFLLVIIPIWLIARKVRKISFQFQHARELFHSYLINFLSGIQIIKIFSLESFVSAIYSKHNLHLRNLQLKSAKYDLITRPVLHIIKMLCVAMMGLFGLSVLELSLSELIVFFGLLLLSYEPIRKFTEDNLLIQRGVAAAEGYQSVMRESPPSNSSSQICATFLDTLAFDHIWFRYENNWALKDVSFKINKGESIAIVGEAGSGKSTILQLILQLFEQEKGKITLNNREITAYTLDSFRKLIAYVPQKPYLFHDTIVANIGMSQNPLEENVKKAAIEAHADHFIQQLPNKYETLLAEMGSSLSGGQQQQITLARAFLRQAPLLLLDEVTASLDVLSEKKIKDTLLQWKGTTTQIIVAHNLSFVEHIDRILVMHKGELIADGSKEQLLTTCPIFRNMWEAFNAKSSKKENFHSYAFEAKREVLHQV